MKPEMKKLIIANLPYLLFVYLFGKLGQAYRLAEGIDLSQKLLQFSEGKLQGDPQSERRCPRGLIILMGPNLRKKLPIQIGFLIALRVRHALLIDFTQYHMRKTFF